MWQRIAVGAVVTVAVVLTPVLGFEVAQARMGPFRLLRPVLPAPQVSLEQHVGALADVVGLPGDALIRPAQVARSRPLARLQRDLNDYLRDKSGQWGVYIFDLTTGDSAGYHQNQVFATASTFKVPMAMYVLDEVARGRASLAEELGYSEGDYEDGTGVIQEAVSEGDTYSVGQLLELAITQSDNIATNMLLRRFGRENVYAYETRLGGRIVTRDNQNVSTPADMGLYLRALFNPQVTSRESRDLILKWMENTAFHDRLAAGLPEGVRVAHKIGTLDDVCNDVGVVFTPKHTYIISVMSRDAGEEYAAEVIAGISQLMYNDTDSL